MASSSALALSLAPIPRSLRRSTCETLPVCWATCWNSMGKLRSWDVYTRRGECQGVPLGCYLWSSPCESSDEAQRFRLPRSPFSQRTWTQWSTDHNNYALVLSEMLRIREHMRSKSKENGVFRQQLRTWPSCSFLKVCLPRHLYFQLPSTAIHGSLDGSELDMPFIFTTRKAKRQIQEKFAY